MARMQRNDRVIFRKLEDGAGGVLLHLDSGEYRRVNEMGATIWAMLEERPSRDELIAALVAKVANPPSDISDQIGRFLDALVERGLIVVADEPAG